MAAGVGVVATEILRRGGGGGAVSTSALVAPVADDAVAAAVALLPPLPPSIRMRGTAAGSTAASSLRALLNGNSVGVDASLPTLSMSRSGATGAGAVSAVSDSAAPLAVAGDSAGVDASDADANAGCSTVTDDFFRGGGGGGVGSAGVPASEALAVDDGREDVLRRGGAGASDRKSVV